MIEKLLGAPGASFHVLDEKKARRMKGRTMYIPSVGDVAGVIRSVGYGMTLDYSELRSRLAVVGKADIACPSRTTKYWKLLAFAHDEIASSGRDDLEELLVPWWRVLKNRKPCAQMPGGAEKHAQLLEVERAGSRK